MAGLDVYVERPNVRANNYFPVAVGWRRSIYSRPNQHDRACLSRDSCQKAVNGTNFSQGNQDYNFSIGNPTAWLPSKSYFRVTMSLRALGRSTTGVQQIPAQPTTQDQLAFADGAIACLYNNVYFRAGGQDVYCQLRTPSSRTQNASYEVRRVDEQRRKERIHGRGRLPKARCSNRIGRPTVFGRPGRQLHQPDHCTQHPKQRGHFGRRSCIQRSRRSSGSNLRKSCSWGLCDDQQWRSISSRCGGWYWSSGAQLPRCRSHKPKHDVRNSFSPPGWWRNIIYGLWQPPIGIFQHDKPMGPGDYRFALNPNSNYQRAAVQSTRLNGLNNVNPPALNADNAGLVPANDPNSDVATSGDFALNIIDVKLYVATVKVSIPQEISMLELIEMEVSPSPSFRRMRATSSSCRAPQSRSHSFRSPEMPARTQWCHPPCSARMESPIL